MQRTILPLLIAALTLTACASGPPPMPTPALTPPQSEMEPCPELPAPQSGEMTDLLANHILVAKAYHECRDRLQGLIDWLEKTGEVR